MTAAAPLPDDVAVAWLPSPTSTVEALLASGADAAGHACPRCGGSDHGRPWARAGGAAVAASASRAGAHLVIATRPVAAPVGVDVEAADAVVDPAVVLHPSEADVDPLWAWVAKEAILKHLGTGLRTDPASIRLADFAVHRIPAPAGFVAAVCTGRAALTRSAACVLQAIRVGGGKIPLCHP